MAAPATHGPAPYRPLITVCAAVGCPSAWQMHGRRQQAAAVGSPPHLEGVKLANLEGLCQTESPFEGGLIEAIHAGRPAVLEQGGGDIHHHLWSGGEQGQVGRAVSKQLQLPW